MTAEMTSAERIQTVLLGGVPDRVPVCLTSTTHGAKLLGMSLREYFSRAEHVVEGQLRFAKAFGGDNLCNLFFAGQEAEAFGGRVKFYEDGSPAVDELPVNDLSMLDTLEVPDITRASRLQEVLRATTMLRERSAGRWPVFGLVVGPVALPTIIIGVERWLDLLLFDGARQRQRLLRVTSEFCVRWANAQLAAGASGIVMAEPMASVAMLTRAEARKHTLPLVSRVVSRIKGPVVLDSVGGIHSVADLIPDTGVVAVSTDPTDRLSEIRAAVGGRVVVLGGLDDQAMLTWTPAEAAEATRRAIDEAAAGGGFILSHQNEIPFAVADDVIHAIDETARRYGRYDADGSVSNAA